MKTYNVTVQRVSETRNRAFNVFVNGKNIGETTCNKPDFGSDLGHDAFVDVVFENAYQMARRVIIHSYSDDVDVFSSGEAKMSFGDRKIQYN